MRELSRSSLDCLQVLKLDGDVIQVGEGVRNEEVVFKWVLPPVYPPFLTSHHSGMATEEIQKD